MLKKMEVKGAILTDDILIDKAKKIAKEKNQKNFKASLGWLQKFKIRYDIKFRKLYSEIFSEDKVDYSDFKMEISSKIEIYSEENVYNMDETGLFYKSIPSKTLYRRIRPGNKNFKDRLSIMLYSNFTGTDKKMMIIGKFKSQRCFKKTNVTSLVNYKASKRAWMTGDIFTSWLLEWDDELKRQKRKILLILDNCPGHKTNFKPSYIELLFLPKIQLAFFNQWTWELLKLLKPIILDTN